MSIIDFNRRGFLQAAGFAGAAWLTPVSHFLARAAERPGVPPEHAQSIIVLWMAGGGYLGDQFDSFRMDDPAGPVPDTKSFLPSDRDAARLQHLDVVEGAFARGRRKRVDSTLHRDTIAGARKMMTSEQLKAFD